MTIHSVCEFYCPDCGIQFIPYITCSFCPNCNCNISAELFDEFLDECTSSCLFNLEYFHSYVPDAWIPNNIGDEIFWSVFILLEGFRTKGYVSANICPSIGAEQKIWDEFFKRRATQFNEWVHEYIISEEYLQQNEFDEEKPHWWFHYVAKLAADVYQGICCEYLYLEMFSVGELYYSDRLYDKAKEIFKKVLYIRFDYFLAIERILDTNFEIAFYNCYYLSYVKTEYCNHENYNRLLGDIAFMHLQNSEYEEAIHYYEKALSVYEEALSRFKGNPFFKEPTKIYKVDVSNEVLKSIYTMGTYFVGKSAEQTLSDLHAGLAKAYEKQLHFEKAIEHYHCAAQQVIKLQVLKKISNVISFQISFFGNDENKFIQLANKCRQKQYILKPLSPIISAWRLYKSK